LPNAKPSTISCWISTPNAIRSNRPKAGSSLPRNRNRAKWMISATSTPKNSQRPIVISRAG